jgi:hypothetical protein
MSDEAVQGAIRDRVVRELEESLKDLNITIEKTYKDALQAKLESVTQLVLDVRPAIRSDASGRLDERTLAAGEAARRYGSDAIRMAFLLNGGALAAMIAFLGTEQASELELGNALACFAVGAVLPAAASLIAYIGQSRRATEREENLSIVLSSLWFWLASIFIVASLVMGVLGGIAAHEKLNGSGKLEHSKIEIKIS